MSQIHSHFSNSDNLHRELQSLCDSVNLKYFTEVCRFVNIRDDLSCLLLCLPRSQLDDLMSSIQVYRWNTDTFVHDLPAAKVAPALEKKQLLHWLLPKLHNKSCEVSAYPTEETLRLSKPPKQYSVAREIEFRLETLSQSLLSNSVVKVLVLRKVNRSIINYKPYLMKLLENFLHENQDFECFCVIEVLPQDGIYSLRDLVSVEKAETQEMFVYSAFHPQYQPITCLVLHMPLFMENQGMVTNNS